MEEGNSSQAYGREVAPEWDVQLEGFEGRRLFGQLSGTAPGDAPKLGLHVNDIFVVTGINTIQISAGSSPEGELPRTFTFEIILPEELAQEEMTVLSFYLEDDGSSIFIRSFELRDGRMLEDTQSSSVWLGYIDELAGKHVAGWVKKVAEDGPQEIDIFVNDVLVVRSIIADQYRADVEAAGYGPGLNGFDLTITDHPLSQGDEITISVGSSESGELISSRTFLSNPFRSNDPDYTLPLLNDGDKVGMEEGNSSQAYGREVAPEWDVQLEGFEGRRLFGQLSGTAPGDAPKLGLHVNDIFVVTGINTIQISAGSSPEGELPRTFTFEIILPEELAQEEMTVLSFYLEDDGSSIFIRSFELRDGRMLEDTQSSSVWLGYIDELAGKHVAGWVKKVAEDGPQEIDIFVNDVLVVRSIIADQYRADVEAAGYGPGLNGFDLTITDHPLSQGDEITISVGSSESGELISSRTFLSNPFRSNDPDYTLPLLNDGDKVGMEEGNSSQAYGREVAPEWDVQLEGFEGRRLFGQLSGTAPGDAPKLGLHVNDIFVVTGINTIQISAGSSPEGELPRTFTFEIILPEELAQEEMTVLSFYLEDDGSSIFIRSFELRDGRMLEDTQSSSVWLGYIDELAGKHVAGWVKKVAEDGPQEIDIFVNDVLVVRSIIADQYRADVEAAGYGPGLNGFDLTITDHPLFQGDEITISVGSSESGELISSRTFLSNPFRSNYRSRFDKLTGETIVGWFVDQNNIASIEAANLYVDDIFLLEVKNAHPRSDLKSKQISAGAGGFIIKNPIRFMESGKHSVYLQFKDGTPSRAVNVQNDAGPKTPHFDDRRYLRRGITIVVPIYNAASDVQVCIDRLLAHTPTFAKIILIDDKSTDSKIGDILSGLQGQNRVEVLFNSENMGFTWTINRGIEHSAADDVILLNSDARVTPGWVEGLLMAASSRADIATVTAMSDRAGAFSAPNVESDNPLPDGVEESDFAREFRRKSLGLYPVVPTGNGFCMFVSRECIASIGTFDVQAFPRGYGEENDFCMRAFRAGWKNIIDDRTYVFHERSSSFGSSKVQYMASGRSVVDERYPEYRKAIQVFHHDERIALARYGGRRALSGAAKGVEVLCRILFVVSTSTGGTPQTNRDLIEALTGDFEGWVLRCDSNLLELTRYSSEGIETVRTHELGEPVDPISHRSREYDKVVGGWIFHYDFDIVHVRHIAWHSLSLPAIAKSLGKSVVWSFHDFYNLSPTVKLIDDDGVFLGRSFRAEGSVYRENLWPGGMMPDPTDQWLTFWQTRFEKVIENCDALVTTSTSARSRILEFLPSLSGAKFHVLPHGRDFQSFHRLRSEPEYGEPIRILIPGNISASKGLEVILALCDHDRARSLEFHILGECNLSPERSPAQVIRHGRYVRDDFAKKVAAIRPHIGGVFSVWDETYCHTLTELWSVGLPVVVFNFSTLADRVKSSGAGWVVDHHDIPKLYDDMLTIIFNSDERIRADRAIAKWQTGYGLAYTTRIMAAGYLDIYRNIGLEESAPRPRIAVVCPDGKSLTKAPASTHIRIWERTRNSLNRDVNFVRMSPASLLASVKQASIDGIIIQRNALPRNMIYEFISQALAHSVPYLLDLDDDLLHVPPDKDPTGAYADYAPMLAKLIRAAAVVTVSTPALVELLEQLNSRTILLRNALSDRLWLPSPSKRTKGDFIRCLYVGTKTHDADLRMVFEALRSVANENENFRVSLIGITTEWEDFSAESWIDNIEVPAERRSYDLFVPWLRTKASQFDFAIAPLVDTAFNQRKSDLKLLECSALGLPVLASDVPNYRGQQGRVRLVQNTTADWIDALRDRLEIGPRDEVIAEDCRGWVLRDHLLKRTLLDFDAMLMDMVLRQKSD